MFESSMRPKHTTAANRGNLNDNECHCDNNVVVEFIGNVIIIICWWLYVCVFSLSEGFNIVDNNIFFPLRRFDSLIQRIHW